MYGANLMQAVPQFRTLKMFFILRTISEFKGKMDRAKIQLFIITPEECDDEEQQSNALLEMQYVYVIFAEGLFFQLYIFPL